MFSSENSSHWLKNQCVLHDIFQFHISLALKEALPSKQAYPHSIFACDKRDKRP